MTHPYASLPDTAFWRRAVHADVDPVIDAPFQIGRDSRIATAGSCFAQHISRTLAERGYHYLVTEPDGEGATVFPARFGNIYTARQLLQTFERAYSLFCPLDLAWSRPDGAFIDPFRPRILAGGYPSTEALTADRRAHLSCVRAMFETCDVLIFTLGLTEAWVSTRDGAVFPLAPGVVGGEPGSEYAFNNFTVDETVADLRSFLRRLRIVNPDVRVILTVSPVPLMATYAPAHVLVATTYSKAVLRVAAEAIASSEQDVCYFPAYEIITGPQARGRYYAEDLRTVTAEGVAHVMDVFARHFLGDRATPPRPARAAETVIAEGKSGFAALAEVVCDEEALEVP